MKFLAANDPAIDSLFGGISPPAGFVGSSGSPQQSLGRIIGFGINVFILVAGLFLLVYLLWGAFDWIVSGGEKEKIQKAQNKITYAVIGMVIVFVVLAVFNLVAGTALGIITPEGGGFSIQLPTL